MGVKNVTHEFLAFIQSPLHLLVIFTEVVVGPNILYSSYQSVNAVTGNNGPLYSMDCSMYGYLELQTPHSMLIEICC